VARYERMLLEGIQFDFDCIHLEDIMAITLKKYFIKEPFFVQLTQKIWYYLLYYYCTDLCLTYPPQSALFTVLLMSLEQFIDTSKCSSPKDLVSQYCMNCFSDEAVALATRHLPGKRAQYCIQLPTNSKNIFM
jgi:hypothetical protein